MIQPEALKQNKPWLWSPGIGTDVWAMFCACITGDLETVKQLVAKDPSCLLVEESLHRSSTGVVVRTARV